MSALAFTGAQAATSAAEKDSLSAVSRMDVDKLKIMPDTRLSNSLQGMASGLVLVPQGGGNSSSSIYVRGLHSSGVSEAIVIIDGIQRDIDDIMAEEIESIEILKDASSKILYGERATNGVVLIKTKRGHQEKPLIRTSLEYGVQLVGPTPTFLDAANYATLFNEACLNDGLTPSYSASDIQGYVNSQGVNDLLYPNVDYYKEFLKNSRNYRKATFGISGGSSAAKYNVFVGYVGNSGIEKKGTGTDLNRFNVRANLDLQINDFMKVSADVAARIEKNDWGGMSAPDLVGNLSTLRPNEYPFMISVEDLKNNGIIVSEDTDLYYGTSTRTKDNLYQTVVNGGNNSERNVNSQTNLGIDLDLDEFAEGLSAKAYITFDNYSYLKQGLSKKYPTYSVNRYIDENGDSILHFTEHQLLNIGSRQGIKDNETYRLYGWNADINYRKTLADSHNLDLSLAYRYEMMEHKANQDMKDGTFSFNAKYDFNKKYFVNGTVAALGSNVFQEGNKYFLAYSLGAAWQLSNEDFLQNTSWINSLVLRANYGHLGYAGNFGYNLFNTYWRRTGAGLDFSNATGDVTVGTLYRWANPNLKWEYSNEFNVGLEGLFFENRLFAQADYFHETRNDIIGLNSAAYASLVGDYYAQENIGSVMNHGVDATLRWADQCDNGLTYKVGINMTYSKNKVLSNGDVDNIEEYRRTVGKPTSTLFGLQSVGLFGKDANLDAHPKQIFGAYTTGDIAYVDMNTDGVVDDRDMVSIGQSFPLASFGLDLTLSYKGFSLYMLGTAVTGITKTLSNDYYRNYGLNAYSTLALDRYHPTNNPGGSQPRLTTYEAVNNNRSSDFWTKNGSYFRLKNVELSYTFNMGSKLGKDLTVFARGANLFVISAIKDADPAMVNAGVTSMPSFRSFTGGVSFNF